MSILKSEPDVKEWSERDERHGRWVRITTWAECLAVERGERCRNTIRTNNWLRAVRPPPRAAEGGQGKIQFNDVMHK
jgi:hypothetical protein